MDPDTQFVSLCWPDILPLAFWMDMSRFRVAQECVQSVVVIIKCDLSVRVVRFSSSP